MCARTDRRRRQIPNIFLYYFYDFSPKTETSKRKKFSRRRKKEWNIFLLIFQNDHLAIAVNRLRYIKLLLQEKSRGMSDIKIDLIMIGTRVFDGRSFGENKNIFRASHKSPQFVRAHTRQSRRWWFSDWRQAPKSRFFLHTESRDHTRPHIGLSFFVSVSRFAYF